MKRNQLIRELCDTGAKCKRHAETCTKCYHPIMDEEGNPKYVSEACAEGAVLLRRYNELESEYWKIA